MSETDFTISSTAQYEEDNQSVRMYLRGRPVVLYVPEKRADSVNYDITKVQPAPSKKLKLDWVYGYRGKDCRSNLYQLPTGEIVYFVAATVVLCNIDEQSQRHYLGHTDDIKSLAIHPNKLLIATGQCAGQDRRTASPHIRIWNSVSLATMAIIGVGDFQSSVTCVSFSQADNGTLLVAIDDSSEKTISVWEWQKGETGKKITETKCSVDTVVGAEFHPLDRNQIITIGKNHIAFWTLDQNGALYKKMGIFDSREKPKYVTCLTFTAFGDVVTGDSNGNIILWGRGTNAIGKFVKKVHEGSVFSLCALRNGKLISGGGKDGRLVLLGEDLTPAGVENYVEPHFGAVRVVTQGKGMQLLVGTTKNCILAGDLDMGFTPVVMGHTDELWGLAIHPNMPQFITGGRDRLLQMWDTLSHSVVWSKDIGEQIQCVEFLPDGELVLVGTLTGKWLVFDPMSRELLSQYTDGQEPIQIIKASPNGTLVAVGSRDNTIYIYQRTGVPHKFNRIGKCNGHSSFILFLDWSLDGEVLRSNSGDYEILFWNPNLCRQITNSSSLRDTEWASNSCAISFETIGIWPEGADGTDINVVNRNFDKSLMATGDDFGKVKLFTYPASKPKSLSYTYGGHSSHVTNLSFLHDDTRLISTGGADTAVLQWAII
ncbi:hypothetical protein ACKWTF_013453 [Chironomus riparius]